MNHKGLRDILFSYKNDWNKYARDILNVHLDSEQQKILEAVQHHRRVSVRSGNARGKDFVAAVASVCFLNLNFPSKVINTGPTDRQVRKIMMTEIRKIYKNALFPPGGEIFENQIKFDDYPDWYLLAFKAVDYKDEVWTGFHSPNLMVVVTEASGVEQQTFNNIESILTGDSRLLIVFNPNNTMGEAYSSAKDPRYQKFKLSCLDAPNVTAKKTIIPGQVDYPWVEDKLTKWCTKIDTPIAHHPNHDQNGMIIQSTADHCFQIDEQWYKPNDLFLVRVMGEFPEKGEDQLIPLAWIEAANQRWIERQHERPTSDLYLGVDVAGMGSDLTVFCHRFNNFVQKFQSYQHKNEMKVAGLIKQILSANEKAYAMIDTIGQGAGVYSRLLEQEMKVTSAKFSEGAHQGKKKTDLTDVTAQRTFANMRAYCHWSIRDALDPQQNGNLALPPLDELTQDLTEVKWTLRSDGRILIEEKAEIKKRLGRSPDYSDALALTYFPISPEVLYPMKGYVSSSSREWGDGPNLLLNRSFLRRFGW